MEDTVKNAVGRITGWLAGAMATICGVAMIGEPLSGLLFFVAAFAVLPPFSRLRARIGISGRFVWVVFAIALIAALFAAGSSPGKNSLRLKTIDAKELAPDSLAVTLAATASSYIEARESLELLASKEFTALPQAERTIFIAVAKAKWNRVKDAAEALRSEAKQAPQGLPSAIAKTINAECGSMLLVGCAVAQSAREMEPAPVKPLEGSVIQQNEKSAERREADAKLDADRLKEERAKAAENAELYRKATPGAGWLTALAVALDSDYKTAAKVSDQIKADSDADYKGRMSQIDSAQRAKYVIGTGMKIGLYGASVLSGAGIIGAAGAFLGGVDVAFSVGDTIRIFKADRNGLVNFTDMADEHAPILGPTLALLGATGMAKKFSEYGRDDLLYINDRVMAFLQGNKNDPFVALVDAANSGDTTVSYYDIPKDGPNPNSAEYQAMPERLREAMTRNNKTKPADPYAETMAKIRAQIGEEEWKKLTLAAAEEKRASDERARKLAAERERKVAEETRKQKAVEEYVRKRDEREHAQKELEERQLKAEYERRAERLRQEKAATERRRDAAKPAPSPPQPQAQPQKQGGSLSFTQKPAQSQAKHGQAASGCGMCTSSGLDCVCGASRCVCCAPGSDCSSMVFDRK